MKATPVLLSLTAFLFAGCQSSDTTDGTSGLVARHIDSDPSVAEDDDDEGEEEKISVDQIPALVKSAAMAAAPGLVITEAEREGDGVYCVHGTVAGVFTEVEVSADGTVLEIESGDDEDHDPEGHEGDDD